MESLEDLGNRTAILIAVSPGDVDAAFAPQMYSDPHLPWALWLPAGQGSGRSDALAGALGPGNPFEFLTPLFLSQKGIHALLERGASQRQTPAQLLPRALALSAKRLINQFFVVPSRLPAGSAKKCQPVHAKPWRGRPPAQVGQMAAPAPLSQRRPSAGTMAFLSRGRTGLRWT